MSAYLVEIMNIHSQHSSIEWKKPLKCIENEHLGLRLKSSQGEKKEKVHKDSKGSVTQTNFMN